MNTLVTDNQTIGETLGQAFQMLQQGPVDALVTLQNAGVNTLNYVFQQQSSGTWSNMDVLGTDLNNTLVAGQVRAFPVASAYPQVRLMANASGGALLVFSVNRFFARSDGGQIPLLGF